MGAHTQTGLAACFSIDEYDRGLIKKHERTRKDKEDDRTRHMIAPSGPSDRPGVPDVIAPLPRSIAIAERRQPRGAPLFDFTAPDGVQHTIWRVGGGTGNADRDALVAAFGRIPALYIADGHHRAASAARARTEMRDGGRSGTSLGDGADFSTVLGVAFPHDQVQILSYNRVVKDLGGTVAGRVHRRRSAIASS